ncbi:MAG TPA: hypothetical protein VNG53_10105, partial [Bacteroidia bacterium]|nr:hypothetical protein [Bacteroidia bacterium]
MKKADSLYKIKKYPKAYEYSKKAIMLGDTYYSDLYNAACNAALSGNISDEFKWLNLTYHYVEKEADDLLPATKENMSLEQLKKTWMGKLNAPCLFISAT